MKKKRKPGGGRKKKFGEPSKTLGTRVPQSRFAEAKQVISEWLERIKQGK